MSQTSETFNRTRDEDFSLREGEASRASTMDLEVDVQEIPSGDLGNVSPSLLKYFKNPKVTRISSSEISGTEVRNDIREEMMDLIYRTSLRKYEIGYSGMHDSELFTMNKVAVANLFNTASQGALQYLGPKARALFGVYCEGLAILMEALTLDKTSPHFNGGSLLRFLLIGVHFGPDRAIMALTSNDPLWKNYKYAPMDRYYEKLLKLTEKLPASESVNWDSLDRKLEELRNIYYEFFRDDGFVPQDLGFDEEESAREVREEVDRLMKPFNKTMTVPDLGAPPLSQTVDIPELEASVEIQRPQARSNPAVFRPVSTSTVTSVAVTTAQATKVAPPPRATVTSGPPTRAETSTTFACAGPVTSTRVTSTPRNPRFAHLPETPVQGTTFIDPNAPEEVEEVEISRIPQPQQSRLLKGFPSLTWDPRGPVTTEYMEYPEYAIRKESSKAPETAASTTLDALERYGIPARSKEAGIALGLSSGVASGIALLTKEHKERNKGYVEEIPRPSIKDFREISYFDFDITGTTVEKILGETFLNTRFTSEGARQATMKAIFQRVIDDPDTPDFTRRLALEQIDHMDVPKMYSQNTYMSALKAAKTMALENPNLERIPDLIPPPVLGRNPMTSSMIKGLFAAMGISQDQKYSVNNSKSKPLKYYLLPLAAKITEERLSETGAYLLLCNILEGATLEQVQNAMYEEKIPFAKLWIILQKTGSKSTSADAYGKELDQLLSKKPEHVEEVLTRIKNIRIRMYANEPDVSLRKKLIQKDTLSDFKILIRNFYPTSAPLIEMIYRSKINAQKLESETHDAFDSTYLAPCPIYTMMETICSVIADDMGLHVNRARHLPATGRPEGRARLNPVEAAEVKEPEPQPKSKKPHKKGKKSAKVDATFVEGYQNQTQQGPPQGPNQQSQQSQQNQQNQNHHQNQNQGGSGPQGPGPRNGNMTYNQNRNSNQNYNRDQPRCALCNMQNHDMKTCYAYPNAQPMDRKCDQCGGRHPGPCKRPARYNNQSRSSRDGGSYGMKHVTEMLEGLAQQYKDLSSKMDSLGNQGNQGVPSAAFLTSTNAIP